MTASTASQQLRAVADTTPVEEILAIVEEDGGVIIEQFLTPEQVQRFNAEIDPKLAGLDAGSKNSDPAIAGFHGNNTKRLTNLITHSKTFREEVVAHDLVAALADAVFLADAGSYWMSTAQTIEIGPGNKAQVLHRDLENFYTAVQAGPRGPEVTINFLTALTDFTDENGATRVIPGSNKWPDFTDRGTPEMTIPAEMKAGDTLFISGKVVHGGGHNRTSDFYRRAVAWTFQPGYLTPEEAYPFIVDLELAKSLPERVQRYIGFRSQYPTGSPGLWQVDYDELAHHIGL
ncbi:MULTISPECIES: phytanoyl-CoA dioxygenase family protein [Rhodococcus]|uniref:phytanoyl-CoA dioxygenase family protein n=1 Tax=Rhodococcus TaxID=1827 RepID=UPI00101F45F9|nr:MULTISPECIES: phytanoyl-CoA dioxygenase family protein [Rhodococcus]UTT50905.1 phytanoyl-CoA dioxygenase family protein [Rhodococcus gordoniae]